MSEIEKMYKNAGVNKIEIKRCSGIKQGICQHNCNKCESFDYKYPPFTAEKQLELIKWMIKTNHRYFIQDVFECEFEESLAKVLNLYWQDLIESEQEQIRSILNG